MSGPAAAASQFILAFFAATFRAMGITTILNRRYRFRGFVSGHARFSSNRKSIGYPYAPARVWRRNVHNAMSPRPETIGLPNAGSSSFLSWDKLCFCYT
jgi:hypothetical protein